jgi:DNA invertase Pin-like site-specific DNA recombinase
MSRHAKTMDAYIRVSRRAGREGDSFQSPEIQAEKIALWAKLHDVTILETHREIDVSGKKFQRPKLDRAMRRIESGATGGLAVMNVKRFGRNLLDGLQTIKRIQDVDGSFASVEDGLDISTDEGRLVLGIMLSMGEFELSRITAASKLSQSRTIRAGKHFRAGIGFAKDENGKLIPGPDADGIRALYPLRADALGWAEIARRLQAEHPRSDGVVWDPSVLPKLIQNPTYKGDAFHGEHRKVGAHEALVSPELWEAAQSPRAPRGQRNGEGGALLQGLIRCASCRYRMKPGHGGKGVPTYRCVGKSGTGRCSSQVAISRHLIDAHVEAEFLARYGDIELAGQEATSALQASTDRVASLERQKDDLADPKVHADLGHENWTSMLSDLNDQLAEAREAQKAARADVLGQAVPDADIWSELSTDERRRVLAQGLDCVMLRRGSTVASRSLILWRGEAPDDLPRRGLAPAPLRPFDW